MKLFVKWQTLTACGLALVAAGALAGDRIETIITLCDNKTQLVIPGLRPGQPLVRGQAFQVAETFMDVWRKDHPGSNWIMAQNYGPKDLAMQVRTAPAAQPAKQTGIYSGFDDTDQALWKSELDKFVAEGNRIFHNADAFGGTVGVSCDMCHPNAANTHPETYPKYQVQMQKVALLRDMINWCIQHPAKGKPLADDDPRLRAMEAYIMSQRAGKTMEPGKH
jgi:thiosulfate dehydrogenase